MMTELVALVMLAVAITMSSGWAAKKEARLATGDHIALRGFVVTYLGVREHQTARKVTLTARLLVEEHGHRVGVYAPSL